MTQETTPGNEPRTPRLEYALTVRLEFGASHTTPTLTSGAKHGQVAVAAGRFWGPRISGTALVAGGDTPVVRRDGIALLDARYFLQAEDGTLIRIHNRGVFRMEDEVAQRIGRGEQVGTDEYYIRTSPTFEVPSGPHDWLTRYTFVGMGRRHPTGNEIDYFAVL
ncbi:DUF3237 domain-containing protein [Microbacterium sp.]|uniref:DUF3237 domain-containing protein n=1 Tax=Microbacterium sp. TaxID=51671 RepID=UPI00092BC5F2|nr:DUF3237 domain-containing protein [Microbacterium sp.]MBN9192022.1 DUF3237 domain-containing protein [Microbacterium sp.]OJU58294.1 MAG: hypothetical protein BGO04_02065 [Microbacterium sp. 70-38]